MGVCKCQINTQCVNVVVTVVTEIPRAVNVFINELKDYAVRKSNTHEEVINTQ